MDVRHYWSVASHPVNAERIHASKREVDAVLSAIARLDRVLKRLPYNSLGSARADQMDAEMRRATNGVVGLVSYGFGSRREDFLRALAELRVQVIRHLGRRRKPGPRFDIWRDELEESVARDLADAEVPLRRTRSGVLAKTLIACYVAAGIAAPEEDSLLPTLKRLAHRQALRARLRAARA